MRFTTAALFIAAGLMALPAPAAAQDDPLDELEGLFGSERREERPLPEDPEERARALFDRGDYSQALTLLKELRKKAPDDTALLALEARVRLETGQPAAIDEDLARALKAHPLDAALNLARGLLAEERGRLEQAAASYNKTIAQTPGGPLGFRARVRLGWLLLDAKDRAGAQKQWIAVLDAYEAMNSLTAEEFQLVGEACIGLDYCPEVKKLFRQNMFKYAQLMFDQSLGQDQGYVPTLEAYGQAYMKKFNFADARKVLKVALGLSPGRPTTRVYLARALLGSYELGFRRFDMARFHLREALQVYEDMPAALATLASLEMSEGRYSDARVIVKRGLARDPSNPELHAVEGALAIFQGKRPAFRKVAKRLLKQRPGCARFYADVADIVGGRFRYAEAAEIAALALELDPHWHDALATYGLNLTRTGKVEEGIKILDASQRADPFNVYVWNTLKVFSKINDPNLYSTHQTAHFEVKIPKEEDPSAPFILELLERAWRELGDKYGARPPKVRVEFFSTVEDFSARSIGLPFIGALGVCFGNTMTILSAKEKRLGEHSWGRTLWHEYAHVVTLTRTKNRVPRWLTEGLSVFEESHGMPSWVREYDRTLMAARKGGMIQPVGEFDAGFSKPKFNGQVMLSYYQGGMIAEFISQRWSFGKILELLDGYRAGKEQSRIFREVFAMEEAEFDRAFLDYLDQKYAGYPASRLAPNPMAQLVQGIALQKQREGLRLALLENPWDINARARLARIYQTLGQDADAATLAAQVRKRLDILGEGLAQGSQGQLEHGDAAARSLAGARALALRQARGDAEAVRAYAALKNQKKDEAIAGFEAALELGCSDAPAIHAQLGDLAFAADDYAAAARHYEAVARLVPPEAGIHRRLRVCYLQLKDYDKALAELVTVCRLDSKDLASRVKAGTVLYQKQRWRELVVVLRDVALINPFVPEPNFFLAEGLRHTGEHAESIKAYEVALKTNYGGREKCFLGQALCHEALGQAKEAITLAQKALADDPDLNEAKELLTRLGAGK